MRFCMRVMIRNESLPFESYRNNITEKVEVNVCLKY